VELSGLYLKVRPSLKFRIDNFFSDFVGYLIHLLYGLLRRVDSVSRKDRYPNRRRSFRIFPKAKLQTILSLSMIGPFREKIAKKRLFLTKG